MKLLNLALILLLLSCEKYSLDEIKSSFLKDKDGFEIVKNDMLKLPFIDFSIYLEQNTFTVSYRDSSMTISKQVDFDIFLNNSLYNKYQMQLNNFKKFIENNDFSLLGKDYSGNIIFIKGEFDISDLVDIRPKTKVIVFHLDGSKEPFLEDINQKEKILDSWFVYYKN